MRRSSPGASSARAPELLPSTGAARWLAARVRVVPRGSRDSPVGRVFHYALTDETAAAGFQEPRLAAVT